MHIDPVSIPILALAVALLALLFGPGTGLRASRAVREHRRTRAAREQQLFEYLRHAAVSFDGLPLFITET
jgi:hypothetical protein